MPSISIIKPLSPAVRRTQRILFQPFQLSKWLQLGFCAFLMGSMQTGGFGGGDGTTNSWSDADKSQLNAIGTWIQEHRPMVVAVVIGVLLVSLVLGLLFTWLSSRGRFMLLDGVVRNRGAILTPWREYRREGNSLFRFRFCLGLISLVALGGIVSLAFLMGLTELRTGLQTGLWSTRAVVAMIYSVIVVIAWALISWVVSVLLMDFVVPVMYLHRIRVLEAWQLVIKSVIIEHPGSFAIYFLASFIINIVIVTLSAIITVITCCIALIPYVGSVVLLPLTIFQLTYPLAFLQQLGSEWQFFPPDRQQAFTPPSSGKPC